MTYFFKLLLLLILGNNSQSLGGSSSSSGNISHCKMDQASTSKYHNQYHHPSSDNIDLSNVNTYKILTECVISSPFMLFVFLKHPTTLSLSTMSSLHLTNTTEQHLVPITASSNSLNYGQKFSHTSMQTTMAANEAGLLPTALVMRQHLNTIDESQSQHFHHNSILNKIGGTTSELKLDGNILDKNNTTSTTISTLK